MKNQVKVQNISEFGQSISGHAKFAPKEIRIVDNNDVEFLCANPYIQLVNDTIDNDKPKKTSKK